MSENAAEASAVGYDFVCDRPRCGFKSTGWSTQELADARGAQHYDEHDTGIAAPELHMFRVEQGLEEPAHWHDAEKAARDAQVAAYVQDVEELAAAVDAAAEESEA